MLVVGGENLIDLMGKGSPSGRPEYVAAPGGSPFNCAKAAARQGLATGYITPVSTDSLGDLLARDIEESGARLLAPRVDAPSSLAVVTVERGEPSYGFYRTGTAERQVSLQALEDSMPREAKAFHVGSLALASGEDADVWAEFFTRRRAAGIFTTLDPNIRPGFIEDREAFRARLGRVLESADLVKLSDEDLEWLYPGESQGAAFERLRESAAAGLCVLTMGADGARARSRSGIEIDIPAVRPDSLGDTVGAGDTFMATLIAGLFRRGLASAGGVGSMAPDALGSLMLEAACAASINCSRLGCDPPDLGEIERLAGRRA